jgi:replicative DNA helicase
MHDGTLAHRLLHHCVDWTTPTQPCAQDTAALERAATLDERALYAATQDGFGLTPSGASIIFHLALAHFRATSSRIPRAELNSQILGLQVTNAALAADANAIVAAAASAGSNGSDVDTIVDALRSDYKAHAMKSVIYDTVARDKLLDADPEAARQKIMQALQELDAEQTAAEGLVYAYNTQEGLRARVDLYTERSENPEKHKGIPLGLPTLDETVGGLKPGHVFIVAGQPKVGKSSFCAAVCLNALLLEEGDGHACDVLLAGREVHNVDQADRIDAHLMWCNEIMHAQAPVDDFRTDNRLALSERVKRAALRKDERTVYKQTLMSMLGLQNKLWLADPNACTTLNDLETIIVNIKRKSPLRLVYVDALHKWGMTSYAKHMDKEYQIQSALIEKLEAMAFKHDIAIIAECQEKPEVASQRTPQLLDLIAKSSDFARTATFILRLFRVPNSKILCEARMMAARFCAADWSFPLYFSIGDMYLEEAPASTMDRIDALCAAAKAEAKGQRHG